MTSQLNNDRRTNQTKTDKQDIYNIKYIEKMDVGLEEPKFYPRPTDDVNWLVLLIWIRG